LHDLDMATLREADLMPRQYTCHDHGLEPARSASFAPLGRRPDWHTGRASLERVGITHG
jgi:hypothetical protein